MDKPFALSQHADWSTLVYPRTRSDSRWVEMETSRPIESWGKSIFQLVCAVFSIGAVIALLFRVMA